MKNIDTFLEEHGLRAAAINVQRLVEVFTSEMHKGLEGQESSLRMIPTYIEADNEFLTETPVLAIDAGGTNFRAALAKFTGKGKLETGGLVEAKMPGLECEVSKDEFFNIIAEYINPLAKECDRIGFCFSYATEILPDKDGRLIEFCKEIRAPEVAGELIGKNLLEALGAPRKRIVILNDTAATLLAGKAACCDKDYDSFIGLILGTGMNSCYIEQNANILKKKELDPARSQIINIESGDFSKAPRTDIDIAFDRNTEHPGNHTFEKMISGGYCGGLCLHALKQAAEEGFFSQASADNISRLPKLTSEDMNNYITGAARGRGPLEECMTGRADRENCVKLIKTLIDRAACLSAATMAAVILKTNKGLSPGRPVLITIEGTTFYKMHNLSRIFEKYLEDYLGGERKRFFKLYRVRRSSLIGAALAGLIQDHQ